MSNKTVRTIADIAKLAGVSKSTVSRALNDSPLIGEETKARIRSIARQHNFQINAPARRLSMKLSRTIAFVTHAYHKDFSVVALCGPKRYKVGASVLRYRPRGWIYPDDRHPQAVTCEGASRTRCSIHHLGYSPTETKVLLCHW